MFRALAIAGALTGVIVACGFHGQGVGPGDAGVAPADGVVTMLADARPSDGAIITANPDAMVDAMPADAMAHDVGVSLDLCTLDAVMCGLKNGVCKSGTCVITVTANGPVQCPSGMPCLVACNSNGVCAQNIDCGGATSCTIACDSNGTCAGQITCPGGATDPCTIICNANNTCANVTLINGTDCTFRCCSGSNNICTGDNWGSCTAGSTSCQ